MHTPAPWKLQRYTRAKDGRVIFEIWPSFVKSGDETYPICETPDREDVLNIDEANAHLIAAAPDNYATNKKLLETIDALLEKIGGVTGIEPERRAVIRAANNSKTAIAKTEDKS